MAKYLTPVIEINEMESEDIILTSPEDNLGGGAGGDSETGGVNPWSLRKSGTIAGGSTVSNIANNSGASNAFSAGDIFGLR